ncbi:hypothetical protein ACOMHN_049960 [Nucella lapillus]
MSYLYDTLEPSVICEEMLMQAVVAQGPVEEAGRVARKEGIHFKEVFSLTLDFKNILKIDGLWEFVNLTKLQLDNNIIEKIEGIDKLVNLVWLDLSFNNIERIEGLDTLTKLQDLSLFNNRISHIEHLDSLVNLQIFSIGSNDLKELDNKMSAYEKYMLAVDTLTDDERRAQIKDDEVEKAANDLEYYKQAFVEYLDGSQLFDSMYEEDPDGQLLNEMPDLADAKFNDICKKIFNFGLQEYQKRQDEVALFWECVEEAKQENRDEGQKALAEFQNEKRQIFKELVVTTEPGDVEQMVNDYNVRVTDLWDKLMGLEMTLLDQLEDVIMNFERNLQDIVAGFIESLSGQLTFMRDAENLHMEKMVEVAQVTSDRMSKNELDEISDDLGMLFFDKDSVSNALQTSHDTHMQKIDNKEDDIITRINAWMNNMMKIIHEEQELKRNRAKVIEINHIIDHFREEIDTLEMIVQ